MTTSIDYGDWAKTYDSRRIASTSVVAALLSALGPARDRRVLDIGGGTGNFSLALADSGFRPAVSDIAPAMLKRARMKFDRHIPMAAANAMRLPFRDASFDCAILVNVLRHIPRPELAFSEARRVLRDGPLVIRTTTTETARSHWAHEYFPTLEANQPPDPSEDELEAGLRAAGFRTVLLTRFWYGNDNDGSFQALKHDPPALLEAAETRSAAVFKRLPPQDLEAGVRRLRADLGTHRLNDTIAKFEEPLSRYGEGVVAAAR